MSNQTYKYLTNRKAELEAQRKNIDAELTLIDAGLKASPAPVQGPFTKHRDRKAPTTKRTVPENIAALLKTSPPVSRDEAIALYKKEHGRTISQATMSAYLSVLKRDRIIDLNSEGKWFYPKKEAP